ncbi:hypothetical protein MMC25_005837 [Agyrium rufum]|nr:hypothetical protein [Agyrium rufum]
MQSFIQYRRFRRKVEDQYGQHHGNLSLPDQSPYPPQQTPMTPPAHPLEAHSDQHSTRAHTPSESSSTVAVPSQADPQSLEDGRPAQKIESAKDEDEQMMAAEHEDPEPPLVKDDPPSGERQHRHRMERVSTSKSIGTRLGATMTGVKVRRKTTKEGGGRDNVFVVSFHDEKDPMDPHNWSYLARWGATCNVALIALVVGMASSIDSAALPQASADFGVSQVTESLATGLFLIGFGCGALVAGPFSEEFGRNPVYIATLAMYMVFIMASALAPNIGAQLAFRFIAGCFASTPLTCAGGSISDLWSPVERVFAFPAFANAGFMGPILGPVIGGFIGESKVLNNWRWTEWITLIFSGIVLCSVVLFQPETYGPILLKWKAAHLRALTGDDRYVAEVEVRSESFLYRVKRALYRPFLLAAREPIIMLFGLYLTVLYIILFTFLNGYTFIFTEIYGIDQGLTGLSFIGIGLGLCLASALIPFIKWNYVRALRKQRQHILESKSPEEKMEFEQSTTPPKLPPEIRLVWAMIGAPAVPISVFWMGWTARPDISIWSPLAASVLFGYGILCIFISCYMYLIDSYEQFAASALASVTVVRYVAAGGMVEVAIPMYERLGVGVTLSILGGLSAILVPVPYLFWKFGDRIRQGSRYAIA